VGRRPVGRTYDLRLTGPAGGRWRGGGEDAAAVVEKDAVAFARTLSGRATGAGLLSRRVPF
jgi:hypothetical protein